MGNKEDYYSLLGIRRDATLEDIRQAYFNAARHLHPDKNIAPGETELFIDVQEAYEVLSNPKKRADYDAGLPAEKKSDSPISHRVLFSRSNLLDINEPQLVYVLFELTPNIVSVDSSSPPLNICLVIDKSSSMQGVVMDVVKETATQIIKSLKEKDIFSLVSFSDRADVIIPAEKNPDPKKLDARIRMIQCSGGTEIFAGLDAGYSEILKNIRSTPSNHLILLTDGRTYGDEKNCLNLAHRASEKGITIRGLGIGPDWNDTFLDELTSLTGGNSIYISSPQDIQRTLLNQITQMSGSLADETRMEFITPDGVNLQYTFRIMPDPTLLPQQSPIQLGSIVKDQNLQILMEFLVLSARGKENLALLDGTIHLKINSSLQTIHIPLSVQRPVKKEAGREPPAAEIVAALSKLTLYRLQEQVQIEAAAGEYDQAAEHLQRLATHLLAAGERGLARTALIEAEEISKRKTISQESQKEIKYGTRALLMSGERKPYGDLS